MINLKKGLDLKQVSTWTGAGSLGALAVIFGVPGDTVGIICGAVIGVLNLFDLFRNEKK